MNTPNMLSVLFISAIIVSVWKFYSILAKSSARKNKKTENILEELFEEIEKILGNRLEIKVKLENCDLCFKNLKKEKIGKAFRTTVNLSLCAANQESKSKKINFWFRDNETDNLPSLALVFLKLFCVCSRFSVPYVKKHLLECCSCQKTLMQMLAYFIYSLNLGKVKVTIFSEEIEAAPPISVIASPLPSADLLREIDLFVNSREKAEIFLKYIPLLDEKPVMPRKLLDTLAKRIHEKQEDLTAEELEKVLWELVH